MNEIKEKNIASPNPQPKRLSLPRPQCHVCHQYMTIVDLMDVWRDDFIDLEFMCLECQETKQKIKIVFEPVMKMK